MNDIVPQPAIGAVRDEQILVLDLEQHAAFVDALDNPPEPEPKLRLLLQRTPTWIS